MKKILIGISLFLITIYSVRGQQVQILDNPPDWPFMLSNLNTTQITSGILYNKVAMSSNLHDYNRGKYNLSHAEHFVQAINELYYGSEQTKFVSANQLKAIISASPINTIDIGIINTTLHQLNFNEKVPSSGGLTFVAGKFVPMSGQPSFLSRKILLASPLKEMATGTAVTYKFSNALVYNNATTAIKNLVLYFNDTTPVSVISNSVLIQPTKTINYSTSGNKVLKFVATFSDNTTITTVGYHYFANTAIANPTLSATTTTASTSTTPIIPCSEFLKDRGIFKSTEAFQGYDETVGYYGRFDYTIFYHKKNANGSINTTQKTIIKPIIIVDGFDPGDTRKTTDCDCEQDLSDGGCFQKNSVNSVFNSISHESIEDNVIYNSIDPISGLPIKENLITKLRIEGYDVIVLNIPKYTTNAVGSTVDTKFIDGGGDYVERNGRALASFLQKTKVDLNNNGSLENIVLLGPSMGGLISRYALAYMEQKFVETNNTVWKHNTRLWVSFDTPHLGANIPMGAQANIWFFGNKLRTARQRTNSITNSTPQPANNCF